jgi:polynucleotide 5'-kinase involved in rRNA processing
MAPGRLSIVTAVRPLGVNVDTVERRFSHLHVRVFTGAVLNGLIVGLEDSCGELLDLGIIQRCDFGVLALAVTSPFTDPAAVHLIRIGCLRLDRDGTDLGAIKPGEV